MDYTFKGKSTAERYDIGLGKFDWAIITIDEKGGLFNCHSSYGDYVYSWPHHGRESFKHFIINELARDPSYLLGKVSRETYFNFDKSQENWKKVIIESRKDNGCTKEQAREAWDFITDLDSCGSLDLIQNELYGSSELCKICDEPWYAFDCITEYPAGARIFANEIMPIFAEILKQELGL